LRKAVFIQRFNIFSCFVFDNYIELLSNAINWLLFHFDKVKLQNCFETIYRVLANGGFYLVSGK